MSWTAKIGVYVDENPRIIKATPPGADLLFWFVRLSVKMALGGVIPSTYADPEYIAGQRRMPVESVRTALDLCFTAGVLTRRPGGDIGISPDKDWDQPLTDAERKRRQREKDDPGDVSRDVTPVTNVTDGHACHAPIRTSPIRTIPEEPSPADAGKTEQLALVPPVAPTPALDFERLYALYPRKEGKTKGLAKCRTQVRSRARYDDLERAIRNYAASVAGKEAEFVKHFSTFMGCWEEYVEAPTRAGPSEPPLRDARDYLDDLREGKLG